MEQAAKRSAVRQGTATERFGERISQCCDNEREEQGESMSHLKDAAIQEAAALKQISESC